MERRRLALITFNAHELMEFLSKVCLFGGSAPFKLSHDASIVGLSASLEADQIKVLVEDRYLPDEFLYKGYHVATKAIFPEILRNEALVLNPPTLP